MTGNGFDRICQERISMRYWLILLLCFPALSYADSAFVTGQATPQEVYDKVTEAARYLEKTGTAGLEEFEKTSGRFVWKDTYVFITQCEGYYCLPGPKRTEIGLDVSRIKCFKTEKLYILNLCGEALSNPNGAWTEFWWPRAGFAEPQRKVSLMKQVPNTPYQVVSDTFDNATSVEELRKISYSK